MLKVGERRALIGDKEKPLAWPPEVKGDVLFLPLRFVVQAFGGEIVWDEITATLELTLGEKVDTLSLLGPPPPMGSVRVPSADTDHPGCVDAVAVSPDGTLGAAAYKNGRVQTWSLATGERLIDREELADPFAYPSNEIAFTRDGKGLLVTGQGLVALVDPRTGKTLWHQKLKTLAEGQALVALAPDASAFASASQFTPGPDAGEEAAAFLRGVEVCEVPSGKRLWGLDEKLRGGIAMGVSAGGRLLGVAYELGAVRLWEVPSGKTCKIETAEGIIGGARLTLGDDGHVVALSDPASSTVAAWSYPERRAMPLADLECTSLGMAAFGRACVYACPGAFAVTGMVGEERALGQSQSHLAGVVATGVSADGKVVASGARDGTVRAYDVADGRELLSANTSDTLVDLTLKRGGSTEFEIDFRDVSSPFEDVEAYYNDEDQELPDDVNFKTVWVKGDGTDARARVRVYAGPDARLGLQVLKVFYYLTYVDVIFESTPRDEASPRFFRVNVVK